MSYLDELNKPQKEAVVCTQGPLLIVAGAGAGKTKTITYRIFHLIKSGVSPEAILAVTFTNKAAQEMRDRIASLMKSEGVSSSPSFISETPFVGTFHALGIEILRNNGESIGVPKRFSIANKTTSLSLIKEALRRAGYDPKQYEPKTIQNIISKNKGDLVSPEYYLEVSEKNFFSQIVVRVWKEYAALLKKESSLDFDDLLAGAVVVLDKNADVRKKYEARWNYIHIDEYQDTNRAQYTLSRLLAGERQNICAVGDSDQNIYSWRGANIQNILRFEKDYPHARIIFLEQNYRSTERILEAAQCVIEKNTLRQDKKLFTKNTKGEKLSLFHAHSEVEEAFFVASKTKEYLDAGVSPDEIAVLYRANFQSRILEEVFLSLDIPYRVLGTRFFDRKEIQDVLAFIQASFNPESISSIKRIINVPPRGIGKVTLAKIMSGQRDSLPSTMKKRVDDFYALLNEIHEQACVEKPSRFIRWMNKRIGMDIVLQKEGEEGKERLENIKELVSLASRYDTLPPEEGITKLLEDALLSADQDMLANKKDSSAVSLMTIHASKGLEFPYVFITGLEEGLFPHTSFEDEGGLSSPQREKTEEERRLFYVALTRAGKKAHLTLAGSRMIYGSRELQSPSRFLGDIPEENLQTEGLSGDIPDEDIYSEEIIA